MPNLLKKVEADLEKKEIMDSKTNLVYVPHVPGLIELSEGSPIFIVCQNDVCMATVDNSLVPAALSKKCGCCGSEIRCFRIASQTEISKFNGDSNA